MLTLLNYESKPDQKVRREGIAIDLQQDKVLGRIDTLKAAGFNPNCIMLLPNHFQKGGIRSSVQ